MNLDRTPLEGDLAALFQARADATLVGAPPLDAIVADGKAAAAKRNRTIGLIAAAAVAAVVAAIAIPVGVLHATGSAPEPIGPPSPHPSASLSTAVQHVLAAAKTPYETAVATNGEVAALWLGCPVNDGVLDGTECRQAWTLQSGDRTWSGTIPSGDDEQLAATGDGFVVVSYSGAEPGTNFVLGHDGSTTPLRRDASLAEHSADPSIDAVAIYHDYGVWVVSAKLDTWAQLLPGSKAAQVGPGLVHGEKTWVGRDVHGRPVLQWRADGGAWQSHALPIQSPYISPGFHDLYVGHVAAARGGMVAAASQLVADDHDPLVGLSVSHDGGRTWTDVPGTSLPFLDDGVAAGLRPPPHTTPDVDVFDMAATNDGTLFVDTWNGYLYRSTDATWTHFAPVKGITDAEYLQPLGDDSMVVTEPAKGSVTLARVRDDGSASTITTFGKVAAGPAACAAGQLRASVESGGSDFGNGSVAEYYIDLRNTGFIRCALPSTKPTGFGLSGHGHASRALDVGTTLGSGLQLTPVTTLGPGQSAVFVLEATAPGGCPSPGPTYSTLSFALGPGTGYVVHLPEDIEPGCGTAGVSRLGLMTYRQLPEDGAADIPFIRDGQLYLGPTYDAITVTDPAGQVLAAGGTVLDVRQGTGKTPQTVALVSHQGQETPIPALGDSGDDVGRLLPVLSPDGRLAAAVRQSPHEAGATITEWSFAAHQVVGTTHVAGGSFETMTLDGIDDQGRVWVSSKVAGDFSWAPGQPQRALAGWVAEQAGAGWLIVGPDGPIRPRHDLGSQAVSPDGTRYAGIDDGKALVVDTATGKEVVMQTLGHADGVVAFESNQDVLVTVGTRPDEWLLRCDVTTGACTRSMQVGREVRFPIPPGVQH